MTNDHVSGPAVANMSLGGGAYSAIDDAVADSVADGVVYALAAGNDNTDACFFSPARTPAGLTVGATSSTDARASFSNYGTCLDLFAPGVAVLSAWHSSDTATKSIQGTSIAAPHVAGAAARVLGVHPQLTPQQVGDALLGATTKDVVTDARTGSPNRLLHVEAAPPTGSRSRPVISTDSRKTPCSACRLQACSATTWTETATP